MNIQHAGSAAFLHFTYREDSRSFQTVGLWRPVTFSVTGVGEPEEVRGLDVTEGVLPLLGVQPAVGRLFKQKTIAGRRRDGGPGPFVLADTIWRRPGASLGRRLLLDGRPREVIGVFPADFRFLDQKPAVIVPIRLDRSATHLGEFNYSGIGAAEAWRDARAGERRSRAARPSRAYSAFRASPGSTPRCSRRRGSRQSCVRSRRVETGDISGRSGS